MSIMMSLTVQVCQIYTGAAKSKWPLPACYKLVYTGAVISKWPLPACYKLVYKRVG